MEYKKTEFPNKIKLGEILGESKVLQYFDNIEHNMAVLDPIYQPLRSGRI